MTLLNVGKGFVTQGSVVELRKLCGLDGESIAAAAKKAVAGQ